MREKEFSLKQESKKEKLDEEIMREILHHLNYWENEERVDAKFGTKHLPENERKKIIEEISKKYKNLRENLKAGKYSDELLEILYRPTKEETEAKIEYYKLSLLSRYRPWFNKNYEKRIRELEKIIEENEEKRERWRRAIIEKIEKEEI